MTEKQKKRRNRLNAREDDFILADMDIKRDDEALTPVPLDLSLDDEETIDRLLIDADFDANKEYAQTKALIVEDIRLADEFGENIDERSSIIADEAIIYSVTGDTAKMVGVKAKNPDTISHEPAVIAGFKSEQASADPHEAGITGLNHNRLEQQEVQKRLNDCEHKVKKAAVIAYVSLGLGIAALLSSIGMAMIIFGMKTEISKLTELVSILEEDMSSITEKNSDMKFNSNDSSIEQLNQKVSSLSKQVQGQSLPATTESLKSKLTDTVVKQVTIKKSLGDLQTRLYALEQKKPAETKVKKVSAKNQIPDRKAKNTHSAEDWSVDLVSYKEKNYAKSKAAKFVQKGVPVKVITVDFNNAKLYRLKVSGFKNKLAATEYASKIKKSLKLNSVSVASNSYR